MLEPSTGGEEACFNLFLLLGGDPLVPEPVLVVVVVDGHEVRVRNVVRRLYLINVRVRLGREVHQTLLGLWIELKVLDLHLLFVYFATLSISILTCHFFHNLFEHV